MSDDLNERSGEEERDAGRNGRDDAGDAEWADRPEGEEEKEGRSDISPEQLQRAEQEGDSPRTARSSPAR